jgi:TPP-dependent pyruvate/acetoin dehydrogenase alpha subunit
MGYASPTEIGIATGVALANKIQNNHKIAVAFCGHESCSSESWNEALHFAGVHQLPILFVCQNDLLAEDISQQATACGFPGIPVDANDVVAVYRVACEAIAHARKGNGPTLIECMPYRLNTRLSIAAGKRRNPETVEIGAGSDPILNMERYLAGKGLFSKALKARIAGAFTKELDAAIKAARKSPPPRSLTA